MSSDLVGSGIPFLDYRSYAERIFFPGHRELPLKRDLDVPACRRSTVEQGLIQLSNLLNSKLFLIKVASFIYYNMFNADMIWKKVLVMLAVSVCAVHPHFGEPENILAAGPCICGVPPYSGTARKAGVLH